MRLTVLAGLIAAVLAMPAFGCGGAARCAVSGGYYLVAAPPDWDGKTPLGAVVYFHGWNSSPEATFRNRAMVEAVTRRGALFVAPWAQTGYWRQIGPDRAEGGRDERAYVRAVMADLATHWPVDPARTLSSGFSRGASMSWNVACHAGDLFAAHAPIAGGFWGQTPAHCPTGPANIRHIHGTADGVVAYDRIGVYGSAPIPEGLALMRRLAGAEAAEATHYRIAHPKRPRICTRHDGNTGHAVEICLHPGGHSIPAEWVAEGYDWMLSLGP